MNKLIISIIVLTGLCHGEIKINKSLSVESALHYDGNLLYPDSITNVGSFVPSLSLKPVLLLQTNKMTMIKIGATGSVREQLAAGNYLVAANAMVQLRHFFSHKSMASFNLEGELNESNNKLLESERLSVQVELGRYLLPQLNFGGFVVGSIKKYPGLYKVDSSKKSFFYDHVEINPSFALSYEASPIVACKLSIGGNYRSYYNDIHSYEFVDFIKTDSIDYIDILGDGSLDTVYRLSTLFSRNIERQEDYAMSASLLFEIKHAPLMSVSASLNYVLLESTDPYYRSREIEPVVMVDMNRKGINAKATFAYGYSLFPDRSLNMFERTPFIGLIIRKAVTASVSAEASVAYRRMLTQNISLNYDKSIAGLKLIWKR